MDAQRFVHNPACGCKCEQNQAAAVRFRQLSEDSRQTVAPVLAFGTPHMEPLDKNTYQSSAGGQTSFRQYRKQNKSFVF
jgi:hypothetical protein